jgi:hypothetical protein
MNREEYLRQVAKWAAEQKALGRDKIEEKPYTAGKMLVRAPWGCLAIAIAIAAALIYLISAVVGLWRN